MRKYRIIKTHQQDHWWFVPQIKKKSICGLYWSSLTGQGYIDLKEARNQIDYHKNPKKDELVLKSQKY